jgi:hypothetical protein
MDWRFDNMYRDSNGNLVSADYEFCRHPTMSELTFQEKCGDDEDTYYYFLERGAVPDKPYQRYRMDFEALGYLFLVILWEEQPFFSSACARNRGKVVYSDDEILCDRDYMIDSFKQKDPVFRAYYTAIEAVSWDSIDPMPAGWYDSLIEILKTSNANM